MTEFERDMMLSMISILNEASDAYYNGKQLLMSDSQFDARLADLQELEKETGVIFANSPSINIGAKILSNLPKVEHNHKMLSLEKCHSPEEVIKFANDKEIVASIKLDGMTASLLYENGSFVRGESRGDGYIGVDITEHIKQFLNVPLKINKLGTYVVDGECIITDSDFAEINKNGEFKNSRNLTSGTLNSLDTSLTAERKLRFIAWDIIEGGNSNSLKDNLFEARELGFSIVPFWPSINLSQKKLQNTIDYVFDYASDEGYPTDGIVFKFDDIEYGKSLGNVEHHFRNGIAYKAKDEECETILKDIEWSCGKTGILTPVAIFEAVELEGTTVERASLHNISVMYDLYPHSWHSGLTVSVKKCNQIIPQISKVEFRESACAKRLDPPHKCPVCGGVTEIKQENNSKVLVCTNDNCKGKLLGKLTHFVSKNAMNVDGMSESTIEKFIELGWLTCFDDIYRLKDYSYEMMQLEGFGEKSVKKLLNSIEKSRNTTLERFIYSMSVPLIGRSASKDIAKACANGDLNQFKMIVDLEAENAFIGLNGFGKEMSKSLNSWWHDNKDMFNRVSKYLNFEKVENTVSSNNLAGKTFCITGSLNHFANRDEAKEKIEQAGGKVSGSVSAKTSYLVNNDVASTSGKNKKAKELGVPIISEEELIKMLN